MITRTNTENTYTLDNRVREYPITFQFLEKSTIVVVIQNDVKTIDVDYTITKTLNQLGSVVLLSDPTDGETLIIKRNTPITQTVSYTNGAKTSASVKNEVLDRLTMIAQELGKGVSQLTVGEIIKLRNLESSKFKGHYLTVGDLPTTGSAGDYADVDSGSSDRVSRYVWDTHTNEWILQHGVENAETSSSVLAKLLENPNTNQLTDGLLAKLNYLMVSQNVDLDEMERHIALNTAKAGVSRLLVFFNVVNMDDDYVQKKLFDESIYIIRVSDGYVAYPITEAGSAEDIWNNRANHNYTNQREPIYAGSDTFSNVQLNTNFRNSNANPVQVIAYAGSITGSTGLSLSTLSNGVYTPPSVSVNRPYIGTAIIPNGSAVPTSRLSYNWAEREGKIRTLLFSNSHGITVGIANLSQSIRNFDDIEVDFVANYSSGNQQYSHSNRQTRDITPSKHYRKDMGGGANMIYSHNSDTSIAITYNPSNLIGILKIWGIR